MCGICGILDSAGAGADAAAASAMRETLVHRGPDDSGLWSEGPIALGFRRLSILDLDGGHQPMQSEGGRFTIVFNGEIYNHPELKSELEVSGAAYRTRSDTETILRLYERRGLDAFARLNGMFALGIWDRERRELVLARDPLGIKPLYYAAHGGKFYFASELRALLAGGVPDEPDPAAVLEYLSYGFVRAPRTIAAGVRKLLPGHWLRATGAGMSSGKFWELPKSAAGGRPMRLPEAQERIEEALKASVRRQLLSDVPLGAFLSGGLDSSLVAALMTGAAGRPVSTFTIGFEGAQRGLDESRHARKVSRHLGTDHHELILPADVLDRIEDLTPAMDEPIADSAILPTVLLSRFARKSVKAVLTGEGADELFAGYNRYKASYLSDRLQGMPAWGRRLAAPLARRMGKGPVFERLPIATIGDWDRLNAHSDASGAARICRPDFMNAAKMAGTANPGDAWNTADDEPHTMSGAMSHDLRTILCDALLMKVDKATMSASLEARVPFLDPGLAALAAALPPEAKMRRLKGKYVLRRIAEKYLPRDIVWRRKHGFIVPWEEWIRRPKNETIEDLLSGSALKSMGVFDMDQLHRWRRVLAGQGSVPLDMDAGLFFRVIVLGLWKDSLRKKKV